MSVVQGGLISSILICGWFIFRHCIEFSLYIQSCHIPSFRWWWSWWLYHILVTCVKLQRHTLLFWKLKGYFLSGFFYVHNS